MSDVYKQYTPPAGGGGLFLKLEDGKPVKVRLGSEPYIFNSEYLGNVSTKYAWAVYNRSEDKGQVLQLPLTAFRMIQNIAADDDWGDPTGYDITITRTGTGKETKYGVTPSPNKSELTTEQKELVSKVDVPKAIGGAIPLAEAVAGKPVPDPKPSDNASSSNDDKPPIESYEGNDEVNLDDIPF